MQNSHLRTLSTSHILSASATPLQDVRMCSCALSKSQFLSTESSGKTAFIGQSHTPNYLALIHLPRLAESSRQQATSCRIQFPNLSPSFSERMSPSFHMPSLSPSHT